MLPSTVSSTRVEMLDNLNCNETKDTIALRIIHQPDHLVSEWINNNMRIKQSFLIITSSSTVVMALLDTSKISKYEN